jgi:hypothetical protein
MTFFSGTVAEVIYNMPAPGATKSSFTTAAVISGNTATNPPFQIPTPLWQPSYGAARLFKVVARGTWSQTATPTFNFEVSIDATQGSAGTSLGKTGSIVTPGATANGTFSLDLDVTVSTVGFSSTSIYTCFSSGTLFLGAANDAATVNGLTYGIGSLQAGTTPPTPSSYTFNPYAVQYLELFAGTSASATANSVTCTQFTVYGCN